MIVSTVGTTREKPLEYFISTAQNTSKAPAINSKIQFIILSSIKKKSLLCIYQGLTIHNKLKLCIPGGMHRISLSLCFLLCKILFYFYGNHQLFAGNQRIILLLSIHDAALKYGSIPKCAVHILAFVICIKHTHYRNIFPHLRKIIRIGKLSFRNKLESSYCKASCKIDKLLSMTDR